MLEVVSVGRMMVFDQGKIGGVACFGLVDQIVMSGVSTFCVAALLLMGVAGAFGADK